ncbi:hypothetical protein [Rhodoplanes sp. Z2-YC6860]|uniref:hypothetical protein n=1 Tax=Rhodoplanes sp. Z2-YC6860 TaxID=674703 RepID=UPI000829C799|nr:hypothetical protein [Rhodoplanes sp. Z2-YC6860]
MFWFRRSERVGSWLALTALALQIVIAAFHFHPGAFAGTADHHAMVISSAGLPGSDDPAAPDTAHDAICGACVLIQLAASAAHPAVPELDVPLQSRWVELITTAASLSSVFASLSFNARAPPAFWLPG